MLQRNCEEFSSQLNATQESVKKMCPKILMLTNTCSEWLVIQRLNNQSFGTCCSHLRSQVKKPDHVRWRWISQSPEPTRTIHCHSTSQLFSNDHSWTLMLQLPWCLLSSMHCSTHSPKVHLSRPKTCKGNSIKETYLSTNSLGLEAHFFFLTIRLNDPLYVEVSTMFATASPKPGG